MSKISNVSKIFEKAILNQILNFFEQNNLFFPYQFGFRKRHNFLNLIQVFLNDVHNKIDNKKRFCAAFINFFKAFDSINHIILLDKLKFQYNFSNKSITRSADVSKLIQNESKLLTTFLFFIEFL